MISSHTTTACTPGYCSQSSLDKMDEGVRFTENYRMPPLRNGRLKKTITRPSYVRVEDSSAPEPCGQNRILSTSLTASDVFRSMNSQTGVKESSYLPMVKFDEPPVDIKSMKCKQIITLDFPTPPSSPASSKKSASPKSSHFPPICITPDLHNWMDASQSTDDAHRDDNSQNNCNSQIADSNHRDEQCDKEVKSHKHEAKDSASRKNWVSRANNNNSGQLLTEGLSMEHQMRSSPVAVYRQMCLTLDIPVSQSLSNALRLSFINLKYHSLGDLQMQALCVALLRNTTIRSLDFSSSGLKDKAFEYVCNVLEFNNTLKELNCSSNKLSTESAKHLRQALLVNSTLRVLDLSSNQFKDSDASHFGEILKGNKGLASLCLQQNQFGQEAGKVFGKALAGSTVLTHLDLSWNQLRREAAKKLVDPLMLNSSLTDLDLSWNGLGLEGCQGLSVSLKQNNTLQGLDVSSNRISQEAFRLLTKGILGNRSIRYLKVGKNPITRDGVMEFLGKVKLCRLNNPVILTQMDSLDMTGIPVSREARSLANSLTNDLPQLQINFSSELQTEISGKCLVKQDFKRLTTRQANSILWDAASRVGLDLNYLIPKSSTLIWQFHDFKEFILTLGLQLTDEALDLILRKISHDGVITPTDILNAKNKKSQRQTERAAHSHVH